jgi:ABC-2 type transport system permease protein
VAILTQVGGTLPKIGVVDQTGQLATVESVDVGGQTLQLTAYADPAAARQAFDRGDIAGYLVIPEDYFAGGMPAFHGEKSPGALLQSGMTTFMRQAMAPDAPAWALARLDDPSNITYVAQATGERVAQGPALIIRLATPAFLALVFAFSIFTGANQMGSAVVREKEQRAMEMVITSISPRQLVTGKVLGTTFLGLTQVGVWVAGAAIGAGLAVRGVLQVQDLIVPWSALLWAALLGIPGYLLYAVIGAGLGVIAGDGQQARQLAGLLGIFGMGPFYLIGAIINNPGGPLSVGLTLFPLTAPTIALFRMTLSDVPAWQLWAALAIILLSLAAAIWFVARIFRAAMLLYGQGLRPRAILRALREA